MAELKKRSRTYSIEDSIEESLAEMKPLDLGLMAYTPEGVLAEIAEEVPEKKNVPKAVAADEDDIVFDEADFDEDFEEEMAEYLAEKDPDTSVVKLPEKKNTKIPTLYSGGGKHLKKDENKEPNETVKKAKEVGNGAVKRVKDFFTGSVLPLFLEEKPEEEVEYVETPVTTEEASEEADVVENEEDEATPSFNEMYTSAKAGVVGFFGGAANFINTKVINPIVDKFKEDEEDFVEEAEEAEAIENRRQTFHVIDRRKRSEFVKSPEEEYEDAEYYEEEEEPSFWRKIWDRFVNSGDDDYLVDDMEDWNEEEEEPGFFEALGTLFSRQKSEESYEEGETEKPKSGLIEKIQSFFYDKDFEEDVSVEGQVEVVEEDYPEEGEDYSEYSRPDPEIYAAIMAEKNKKIESCNANVEE